MNNSQVSLINHKRFSENRLKKKTLVDPLKRIRQGIWLYFFLLLIEGGLRKWIFPEFATPLLVVRDPIAFWLIMASFQKGIFELNSYIIFTCVIAFIAFGSAIFFGHGNIYIALFGVRILIFSFPLIFVIGRILNYEDVIKIGRVLLWVAIPMTGLMIVQFYSPQSDWVNRGVGGDISGGGFSGALGYFRPPGTFSFISGLASFYGLVAGYVLYFWLDDSNLINKWLLCLVTSCLLISIPFSISRSLFFEVTTSAIFSIFIVSNKPKYLIRIFGIFFIVVLIIIVLNNVNLFQTGLEVFLTRFELANEGEGGAKGVLVDRFLGGMLGGIFNSVNLPFWGYGIGIGTNVGSMLMTGRTDFIVAEEEWGRLIGEMGLLLGMAFIFLRLFLAIKLSVKSYLEVKKGNFLPWMLLSFGFLQILQGQWGQPTALGFATLTGGLILASFRKPIQNKNNN